MASPMTAAAIPAAPAPDLAAIKTKQQAAWSSGDYAIVGSTLQIVGEDLVRGNRPQGRLEGTRRRRRQRHGEPRRRTALVRRHVHRLRAGAAGTRPRPRRGRRHGDRIHRGRRRKPALRRQQFRCGALDLRRDVHAEPGQGRRRIDAGVPARREKSASPTGRRTALSVRCSRRSANICRRRPARNRRRCGARTRGSTRCSAPAQLDRSRAAHLQFPLPLGPRISSTCSRPSTARC